MLQLHEILERTLTDFFTYSVVHWRSFRHLSSFITWIQPNFKISLSMFWSGDITLNLTFVTSRE